MNYSILDASNDFVELSNKIGRFEEKLCTKLGLDPESQDPRLVFLDSIQQNLLSLTSYIRAFMALQEKVSSAEEFLGILNVGVSTVEEFEKSKLIYKFPIESLMTMTHFKIDAFLGDICSKAGMERKGFYNRMKCVLDTTDFEDTVKTDVQNTLQCLAFFRNSFHNAGFHRINEAKWTNKTEPAKGTLDRKFEKSGGSLEFKHKELIEYNWKNTVTLLEHSILAVQSILESLYKLDT